MEGRRVKVLSDKGQEDENTRLTVLKAMLT